MILFLALACGGPDAPDPEPVTETVEMAHPEVPTPKAKGPQKPEKPTDEGPESEAMDAAFVAATHLGKSLKMRLVSTMKSEGPEAALEVCADEAQGMTALAGAEKQAKVGRSSLKLRNPKNAGPPWVTAWLEEKGEAKAAEVEGAFFVEEDTARVVLPIGVEPPCLVCHGEPAQALAETIAERYPEDEATGYAVGDLRGALWAEVPVN